MGQALDISVGWQIVIIVNCLIISVLLITVIINTIRLAKLRKKYNTFMRGQEVENIEQLLKKCLNKVHNAELKSIEMENHMSEIDENLNICVQKVGVVRYNAFADIGSDMSFSIAFLDASDRGVVISGLYSRESSATYAKPLIRGESTYALSREEKKAISIAQKKMHRNLDSAYK